MELVSIVIPFFNAEKFLAPLVESLIRQTFPDWEAIFVDDGSQDRSSDILEEYSMQDNRIKVIHRDRCPKGAPTCRNIGTEVSRGKYLIYLDADDIIADFCLEQRVDAIKANDVDCCVFPLIGFNETVFDCAEPQILGFQTGTSPLHYLIQKQLPFVVVTNIYKKDSLVANDISWDENVSSLQDSDFNIECLMKGLKYKVMKIRPDYYWRMDGNASSITKNINARKHFSSHLYLFNKQSGYFSSFPDYRKDLDSMVFFLMKKFIYAGDCNIIKQFASLKYFEGQKFYLLKLRLMSKIMIHMGIHEERMFKLIYLFFFPFRMSFIRSQERNFAEDYARAVKQLKTNA